MKCLKNVKSGEIVRVNDKQAHQMAGSQWQYVSKKDWKGIVTESPKENVEVGHDMGGSYEIKKEKKSKKVSK
jgi:hypothetical protein